MNYEHWRYYSVIAYKACRSWYTKNDPSYMYRGAIGLLQLFVTIHIVQILVLFYKGSSKQLTTVQVIVYFAFIFLLGFLLEKIFPRKRLRRVLQTHEGSKLGNYSKLIIFSYMILNILVFIWIAVFKKSARFPDQWLN